MNFQTSIWLKISLINLFIVASLGVLMRYKIGFDFPYFNQYNIHHAHSHFAFIGWITHTLFVLMASYVCHKIDSAFVKQYHLLIGANLLCAYGLVISFFVQGYGLLTIILLLLTIVVATLFTVYYFIDLKRLELQNPVRPWFQAALSFNLLSTIGTFYLAYMMMTRHFNEKLYLASEYFYLHFQYNGFFIFACLGLFISNAEKIWPAFIYDKNIFRFFFASAIPAYFLSVLWANLPVWLYVIVVIAAFLQVLAWSKLLLSIKKSLSSGSTLTKFTGFLFLFIGIAFTIKLLLQLGSTIPALSKLAFGFRPVVIAYLHLVLLAVVSIFLLTIMYSMQLIRPGKWAALALSVFLCGVFLNESVLAIQGIASFSYTVIPNVNTALFIISLILFAGACLIVLSQTKDENAAEEA